jgi:hypothetical protein
MKQAAAAGQVEVLGPAPDDAAPFGLRITVHPTARGPRRAVTISESLVDGIIAAFHAGASTAGAAAAAAVLAPRLPGVTETEIAALAGLGVKSEHASLSYRRGIKIMCCEGMFPSYPEWPG